MDSLPDFVEIPAGPFQMGHDSFSDASPRHQVEVAAFRIRKYPVTNSEFADFVAAKGYQRVKYWTKMGWKWRQSRQEIMPAFWNDDRFNDPRQPIVGVSWYEAVAYCNWLSENYSHSFVLPSEAEWEKVARGSSDARNFPWGDEFEIDRANTVERGLGRPTPAGLFPLGMSPYGVHDLAGNVFEWTRSKWGANWQEMQFAYPYRAEDGREDLEGSAARVMRGGSWFNTRFEAHVSHRARYLPGSRASNIGFRIAETFVGQIANLPNS